MMRMPALAFAALLVAAALLAGQGKPETAGYIVRLGTDTIAVEQTLRTPTRLESEIAVRVPTARRVHYLASLDSAGRIERFDLSMRPLGSGGLSLQGSIQFGPDTAIVAITRRDSTEHLRVAVARGAVPLTAFSSGLFEQAIRQARRVGGDSVAFAWLPFGRAEAAPSAVVRRGKDSVDVGFFGSPMHARTDKHGRLLGLDGRSTTQQVLVTRVNEVNVGAFATAIASAEMAHGPMGQLSGRDTVRAELGPAHVMVDYGRPHRRGRQVFGGVVPWDQVWRTGANAATQLTTDADLRIGDAAVPKGSYTLWSIPTPAGATLIVNTQTGQWGTEYDPARDLVRIPMQRETLPALQELFTIAIEPSSTGHALRLSWDTTGYVVPIAPAP
jgi:DUF2911 family protein